MRRYKHLLRLCSLPGVLGLSYVDKIASTAVWRKKSRASSGPKPGDEADQQQSWAAVVLVGVEVDGFHVQAGTADA